jgi:hypothetical protein
VNEEFVTLPQPNHKPNELRICWHSMRGSQFIHTYWRQPFPALASGLLGTLFCRATVFSLSHNFSAYPSDADDF